MAAGKNPAALCDPAGAAWPDLEPRFPGEKISVWPDKCRAEHSLLSNLPLLIGVTDLMENFSSLKIKYGPGYFGRQGKKQKEKKWHP